MPRELFHCKVKLCLIFTAFLFLTITTPFSIAVDPETASDASKDLNEAAKPYVLPPISHPERIFFFESFQKPLNPTSTDKSYIENIESYGWTLSTNSDYADQQLLVSDENATIAGDRALFLKSKHVRYGLSKALEKPFSFDTEQVTIQFEARFHNKLSCSGAYLKFVAYDESNVQNQKDFKESTPYVLMFGPDKCGGTDKVHVIFRHQNPVSKEFEEKHMLKPVKIVNDRVAHLYTLQLKKSDQSVRVLIDREEKALSKVTKEGSFRPNFTPEKMIDDPDDKKPSDWVDDARIDDPDAKKPEDWDLEPEFIADDSATKPDDWNDEEDGDWEVPMVNNPKYRGVWKAPKIDNPNYKGVWKPKKIENPNYFEQDFPLATLPKISHVFIEVLANDADISFDNILITEDYETGKEVADSTFGVKHETEKELAFETELKEKKELRDKKWDEDFGIQTAVDYAFGEAKEFVQRNFILTVTIGTLLFAYLFYRTFFASKLFRATPEEIIAAKEEERKEKEAKHKKDDEKAKEKDDVSPAEVEELPSDEDGDVREAKDESEKDEVIRRRTRRAD